MSVDKNERRNFLKIGGLSVAAALIGSKVLTSSSPAQAAGPVAVKPTDNDAKALGYTEDATKVDTKKWPKRAGADGAKQFCYTCQFFQAKADPKKETTAPCMILSGKLVKNKAWCNTWTQNPKVQA